jgi:hypothetical protein
MAQEVLLVAYKMMLVVVDIEEMVQDIGLVIVQAVVVVDLD